MQAGNSSSEQQDCAVIIIGARPLRADAGDRARPPRRSGHRAGGKDPRPARFPAANATQARTMEHYRRLGFAEKVRAQGLPPDYPTDIAYFTRYTKHELARFSLPSARAGARNRQDADRLLERRRAAASGLADVRRGRAARGGGGAADGFAPARLAHDGAARHRRRGVEVEAERIDGGERTTLRAAYAVGADGGGSPTRKSLGYSYAGESGVVRDFMGGRMFAIHFRSAELYDVIPHPRAWMYWAVNRDRRAFMADGQRPRRVHLPHPAQGREQQRRADLRRAGQGDVPAGFSAHRSTSRSSRRSSWNAGYTLVAEKFQRGAHLSRRRRGASVHAGRRAWLQHRGRGCGQSRLEARRRAQRLGRAGAARQLRDRAAGDWRGATPTMRAALPIRWACSCRPPNSRTTARPARPRASAPAIISIITPVSSSTFRASPSAAATTARR